jgi:peptide/nickel transport system substrate-binding protein
VGEYDDLTRALRDGSLSRRHLLGGAAALGAAAAAGLPLLGAQPAQAAEEPRKGGTLRIGMAGGSTTDSLDPTTWTDTVGLNIGFALWNGLIENGPDNKPVPELAESWEAKPGAMEWVFNLRKGIKFSNGKEFDADDAIYSLNLHRGASKSGAAGSMKAVTDIKKLDSHQILLTLASGDADLPYVLSDYHLSMVPNGFKDWANPIGTGGYTLDKFDPGVRCSLKRNTSYWKPGRANADIVQITVINDGSARLSALLSGQVDIIHRVDPKTVALLKKNPKIQVVQAPGGWHAVMPMMVDREPYTNPDLRLALKYGIDRESILKALFAGYGSLGNDHPIPKGDPYFNSSLPQTKYDADKARFYFKKAGSPTNKILLQASDAAFDGAVDMAALFQASAKKAGIPIDIKKEPADGFWDNVWLKGSFITSYWGGRPAATQMLAVGYKSDAPWNDSAWRVPAFDKLLGEARGELDEGKRKTYIWAMQEMLHSQGGVVIPVFKDWIDAHNVNVGGHTPHNGFDLDNGHICEKAWLKS